MHTSIDQDLGDGVSKAVAIEDAGRTINGGFCVALAGQMVCQGTIATAA
ncbi:hypothetical protein L6654_38320 [Bradyrhizobium sp. WYCCWR 13023]|uniref:Uncharacterized protein n=1 Tax=Bradyrhizobium zhengyangense TaxID=2911009 RepID=A0A9X1RIU1_9BRAD|nr:MULTISPECIES: hypothetical protein [Bradyrhizobium]MCG2632465.1 hypothetical protein [Bradyrhizobium zhengyangense]MCG2672952.1 hypothetical protein [Bradyrhizobium zhengyangense]